MRPRISIIIVNYNGLRFLEKCLSSVYAQKREDVEIIFVDNGSVDDSVAFVRDKFPAVQVLKLEMNTGFAKGNNVGIEAARGDYILTLNNDTELQNGFLDAMFAAVEKSGADTGMWAPKILSMADGKTIDSVGGLLIYGDCVARGRGRLEHDLGQYDGEEEIFIPSACAALYRRDMLREAGFFDEDFFAYCEDTDLGLRCRLLGWKARSVPCAVVLHHYSGTGGRYSEFKAGLVERNRVWVAVKNLPVTLLMVSIFYTVFRYGTQLYGVLTGKGAGARLGESVSGIRLGYIVVGAYVAAFKRLPAMLKKRSVIYGKKVVTTKEIKRWFDVHGLKAVDIALKD